jgi:hypothetical protein
MVLDVAENEADLVEFVEVMNHFQFRPKVPPRWPRWRERWQRLRRKPKSRPTGYCVDS